LRGKSSNLGRVTRYTDWEVRSFSQCVEVNAGTILPIRIRLSTCSYSTIQILLYSLFSR
jgi:hypothetical protein